MHCSEDTHLCKCTTEPRLSANLTIVLSFVQARCDFLGEAVTKQVENKYISHSKFGVEDILNIKQGQRWHILEDRAEIRSCSNQAPSPLSAPCLQHPQVTET